MGDQLIMLGLVDRTLGRTPRRRLSVIGGMLILFAIPAALVSGAHPLSVAILSALGVILAVGLLLIADRLGSRFGAEGVFWVAMMLGASLVFRAPTAPDAAEALLTNPLQVLEPLLAVVSAAFLGLRVLRAGRDVWDWVRHPLTAPMLLYALLGFSAVFFPAHRVYAVFYAAELGVVLGLTILVGRRERGPASEALDLLLIVATAVVALALAVAVVAPSYAFSDDPGGKVLRLGGWLMHPNQLGFIAAAAGLGFLRRLLTEAPSKRLLLNLVGLAGSAAALAATRGRADLAAFVVGAGVLLVASRRAKWLLVAAAPAIVVLVLRPQWAYQLALLANRGMTTLRTSRPELWLNIWNQTLASPLRMLRGVGIGVGRFELQGLFRLWPDPAHAHNAVMEGLLALGFPGAFLILWAIVALGWRIVRWLRAPGPPARALVWETLAQYACLVLVSGFAASFAGRVSVYTCGYLALAAAVMRFDREMSSRRDHPPS